MIPVVVVLLAVIAFFSVRSFRERISKIASALENQNAPARSEPMPQEQSAAPAPPVANPTEPANSEPATKPQPDNTPQAETQAAPSVAEPEPEPPSAPPPVPAEPPNTNGLVAKQVLPTISPGARHGIRGTVEVIIRVSVNQDGVVSNAAYVSPGPGKYFARLAQRAALSWESHRQNGTATLNAASGHSGSNSGGKRPRLTRPKNQLRANDHRSQFGLLERFAHFVHISGLASILM